MPQNREYPAKTRSVAVGKAFPAKTESAAVNEVKPPGLPSARSGGDSGNAPKKGVLTTGGGHG